jgi:hypothetical protein
MKKSLAIMFMIGVVFSVSSYSQNAPKKRGLDQFDLSEGIRVDKPQGKGADTEGRFTEIKTPPREPERVDESTYHGVRQMVQEAISIDYLGLFEPGGHFRFVGDDQTSASRDGGPSARSAPDRILSARLNSLNRVVEIYRVGLLDQKPLQDRRNVDLLTENQKMISDIMRAMDVIRGKQFDCEVYEIKPLCSLYYPGYVPHKNAYEKKVLIAGMLTQLKKNFEMLRRNIALNQ